MTYPDVSFHNVAELVPVDDGHRLQRVPEAVRDHLNETAAERMTLPTGCEIRFVADGEVTVTLSSPSETTVYPFWGPLQNKEVIALGPEATEVTVEQPEIVGQLDPAVADEFVVDPSVCRLRFTWEAPVRIHGVEGDARPPHAGEVPDNRVLCYGTSITERAASTGLQHTYPAVLADELGADVYNVGAGGSAYCETELSDHFAARDDWDVAVFAISSNMLMSGFTIAEFRERATHMVEAAAETGRPVACVTLYTRFQDLCPGATADVPGTPAEYREALREIADDAPGEVHLYEGTDILDADGLSVDLIHPGDRGTNQIGRRLATRVADLL